MLIQFLAGATTEVSSEPESKLFPVKDILSSFLEHCSAPPERATRFTDGLMASWHSSSPHLLRWTHSSPPSPPTVCPDLLPAGTMSKPRLQVLSHVPHGLPLLHGDGFEQGHYCCYCSSHEADLTTPLKLLEHWSNDCVRPPILFSKQTI